MAKPAVSRRAGPRSFRRVRGRSGEGRCELSSSMGNRGVGIPFGRERARPRAVSAGDRDAAAGVDGWWRIEGESEGGRWPFSRLAVVCSSKSEGRRRGSSGRIRS